MKNARRAGIFTLVLGGALGCCSVLSFGTVQIAKKEKAACTTCHVKVGSKELNAVGKCYQKHKSLKACEGSGKTKKK